MFVAPLLLAAAACSAPADVDATRGQWPRFRGPNGAGVAEGRLPTPIRPGDFAWTTPLPGAGVSSAVVWDDAVFVTAADGPRRLLIRLEAASGAVEWTKDVAVNPGGPPAEDSLHAKNNPAAATPALDAARVFTLFSDGERFVAHAFTHAGEPLWRRDLGRFQSQHGHGSSPVRVDVGGRELLVLTNDQEARGGVTALDAGTGEVVWTTPRESREAAYSAPVVMPIGDERAGDGRTALVSANGAAGIVALDAATGAELWRTGEMPARVVASPVMAGGKAWALCGQGGAGKRLVGADLASGDVLVERDRSLPYVPTPVAVEAENLLILWGDRGVVTALDSDDGEVVWTERVGGNYSSSPIVVGDAVLCVTEEGVATVIDAAREYRLRGRFPLGAPTYATPAVSRGRLFFRLRDRLVCLPLGPTPAG